MLIPLLFTGLSVMFGWQVVRQLPMVFYRLEAIAFSVVIGIITATWTVFIAALLLGFAIGLPVATVLLLSLTSTLYFFVKPRYTINTKPYVKNWRWLARISAGLICSLLLWLTYLSYQFPAADGTWITNGNVYGDGPLHVSLANQFAIGNSVDLVSSVYQKAPLTYPFLSDFYSGVLRRLGADWQLTMVLPSALVIVSLAQLIFSFGYRLLRSTLGAWLQFLMLIFGGSLHGGIVLGWVLFTQGIEAYHEKIGNAIVFATGDQYLNIVYSHFLPQRSYLFGMALFIVAASITLEIYRSFGKKVSLRTVRITALAAGVLIGMMPMVHMHSFLVAGSLLVLATVGMMIYRRLPTGWWWLVVSAGIVAMPQLIWQFGHSFHGHFISFITGWMMQNFLPVNDVNIVWFWLGQLGLLLVVMLAGWYWLYRYHASAEIWLIYVAGLIIFVLCNVISFQPSLWDNMKLFNYAFWFFMIVTAYIFLQWRHHHFGRLIVIVGMTSLCLYGVITLCISGPRINIELLSKNDVAFGEQLRTEIPETAYVLVTDRHSHPVTMLSDRKVLVSYSGWYNLYGEEWGQIVTDRDAMLQGATSASSLIAKYELTHAVFSDNEVSQNTVALQYFLSHYKLVSHDKGWWVFDLGSRT